MDWIESRARLTPDDIAVVDGDTGTELTYLGLHNQALKWAMFFKTKGVKKGDRICLVSENDPIFFEVLFGCAKIGAIFVPLNWRLSEAELEHIVMDCSPSLMLYSADFEPIAKSLSMLIETISIEQNRLDSFNEDIILIQEDIFEKDPWMMIYTGGTTGKSKGVVLSYQSVNWNAVNTIISWGLNKEDKTLTYLPLFHTGGINALSIPILMAGGKVVIGRRFTPEAAIAHLNKHQITIALFVPTMYHMMIQSEGFSRTSFDSMKVFLSGGAPCPLSIYEFFAGKGLAFKEGYGLTEAGPNNFYIDPKIANEKRGSVGKAMVFNSIKIIDPNGKEAKSGQVGELLIRGKHVFSCYWNNEEETLRTVKGGWLHTGDLARKDEDGYIYIVGRKKDMIITGGENVYPLEIEHWLCEHPMVDEAAVIGIPDEKWGEKVTAFLTTKGNKKCEVDVIQRHCLRKFKNFKMPKDFVFVEELPKTHVGKIDKKSLKSLWYMKGNTIM
ncbi:long-chain fatty acid--CoA ligase [Falsibacillus albus]|uniref:Long-chain fatty acid--CoA ligase n=2 Tax=Falsibacillus albus TaxID=2478915 RepID=A0A3L7K3A4_9BACI|nr:long-chain fatty acid--CoA ligase [Falsibacillus albus]